MCAALARRIARVSRTVSDLGSAVAFHTDALDFRVVDESSHHDRSWGQLMGVPGLRSHSFTLRLGKDELELVAFDPPGAPFPPHNGRVDVCVQQIAIAVSDIDAAFNRLCGFCFTSITEAGPQPFSAEYGGGRGYKFRDADGHALALVQFAHADRENQWQQKAGVFLGIDHTAIDVADIGTSIDFYTSILGMAMADHPQPSGAARECADPHWNRIAQVIDMHSSCCTNPHLKLLEYGTKKDFGLLVNAHVNDIFADRMIVDVDDLPELVDALRDAHVDIVSLGLDGPFAANVGVVARDPTGHLLEFHG